MRTDEMEYPQSERCSRHGAEDELTMAVGALRRIFESYSAASPHPTGPNATSGQSTLFPYRNNGDFSFFSCTIEPNDDGFKSTCLELPPCTIFLTTNFDDARAGCFGVVSRKTRRIPTLHLTERVTIDGFLFTPHGMSRMALKCNCDAATLEYAIARCSESPAQNALPVAFGHIRRTPPCPIVASAIYESTAMGACALALQEFLEFPSRPPLSNGHDKTTLELAKQLVRDMLSEGIRNKELALTLGISESKLTSLFKAETGMTVQEFARSLRLEEAKSLLEGSDLSMSQIAERIGFARQGSFSETFKTAYGMTPYEHRKNSMRS